MTNLIIAGSYLLWSFYQDSLLNCPLPEFLTCLTNPRLVLTSSESFCSLGNKLVIPLLHKTPPETHYLRDHFASQIRQSG